MECPQPRTLPAQDKGWAKLQGCILASPFPEKKRFLLTLFKEK